MSDFEIKRVLVPLGTRDPSAHHLLSQSYVDQLGGSHFSGKIQELVH